MKRKRDDNQLVLSFFDEGNEEKENNWQEHWDGMPEWCHPKIDSPYKIIIRCENQTDWIALGELLSVPLHDIPRAAISTRYPPKNKRDLKSYRIQLEAEKK